MHAPRHLFLLLPLPSLPLPPLTPNFLPPLSSSSLNLFHCTPPFSFLQPVISTLTSPHPLHYHLHAAGHYFFRQRCTRELKPKQKKYRRKSTQASLPPRVPVALEIANKKTKEERRDKTGNKSSRGKWGKTLSHTSSFFRSLVLLGETKGRGKKKEKKEEEAAITSLTKKMRKTFFKISFIRERTNTSVTLKLQYNGPTTMTKHNKALLLFIFLAQFPPLALCNEATPQRK